jgi:molybdenum cofactor biosynthesis protein B
MRSREFKPIRIALLTLSDTRTLENDTSGDILAQRITDKGHVLATRKILREDVPTLVSQLDAWIDDPEIDCIISTGGTGLTGRDVTPEALEQIIIAHSGKLIPGFGELFRWLSYKSSAPARCNRARWRSWRGRPISLPCPDRMAR